MYSKQTSTAHGYLLHVISKQPADTANIIYSVDNGPACQLVQGTHGGYTRLPVAVLLFALGGRMTALVALLLHHLHLVEVLQHLYELPQVQTDAEQVQTQSMGALQVVVSAVGQNIVDVSGRQRLARPRHPWPIEVPEEGSDFLIPRDQTRDIGLQSFVDASHLVGWCERQHEQPVKKPPYSSRRPFLRLCDRRA